jgi:hypothetical protein
MVVKIPPANNISENGQHMVVKIREYWACPVGHITTLGRSCRLLVSDTPQKGEDTTKGEDGGIDRIRNEKVPTHRRGWW